MGTKKALYDYATDIFILHKRINRFPDYHPDYDRTNKQLSRQLTAWSNLLNISVEVAQNEQLAWRTEEIGYTCHPMITKKESLINQTGDYIAFLEDYDQYAGICTERKTLQDLYSSLMDGEQRSRLMREIARYEADTRFNKFILIAECDYEDFIAYVPAIYVCQWEAIPGSGTKKLIEYFKKYYKIDNITSKQVYKTDDKIYISCEKNIVIKLLKTGTASLMIDGVMVDTLYIENKHGKNNLYQKKGASEASKIETMNSLENKIQVSFAGSRERAVQKYPGLVRQWCRANYDKILNFGE